MRLRPALEGLENRDVPATWGFAWPMAQIMTISFVPDGTQVGTQSSNLSAFASRSWGSDWEVEALRALETWVSHAAINVGLQADDGEPLGSPGLEQGSNNFGDIRVAAVPMANDVIASAVPFNPAAGTWSGDVLLNSAYTGTAISAYAVFLHEFGHVFGFSDNLDPTSVNYRYFSGSQTDLSPSDIAGLQNLYEARQPDAYEGATATPLAFASEENSQSIAADIITASDVDNYLVTLPTGSNELEVKLKTSGLSLLTSTLTVFDASGSVVGSATATDPRSGDLAVLLDHAAAGQTYRITVRASNPAFGVGQYGLTIETDHNEVSTAPSAFLTQFGSTYLLSLLSDGVSSNPSEFQSILQLLFASGGDPSLYSDNVKDGLANDLAQAGSTPQGSQSIGTLLTQILAAQGSSQLDASQFAPVLNLLNQSGVMKQVVSDLINSGSLNGIVTSLISSGQLGSVFQSLIDSGTFAEVLKGAVNTPQGPALLDAISGILLQTFDGQSGAGKGQTGASALTAHDMDEFYIILLDNHILDPVFASFINSGFLYNMLASVSQEALNQGFEITLGLAEQPDQLGAELRQFFGQAGFALAPGTITAEENVNIFRALMTTPFFDDYFRALVNAGGVDPISGPLTSSGAFDLVFSSYLTSEQLGTLVGAIVNSNLLPVLAQAGLLNGAIKSAIEEGAIAPLLDSFNASGALSSLTVALLNSGTSGPLFDALLTSDKFSNVLIQMFEAGQLGPITEELASSGALADAINGLVSSGQLSTFIADVLSINSPALTPALDELGTLLLPTPATSFDEALPLASSTVSNANAPQSLSAVGVLGDASPVGMYKLVVPTTPDGAPAAMIVSVWRQEDTLVQPEVTVFDQRHQQVASQLLKNNDGDYVVQVLNPTPGQTYYLMVGEAAAVGTTTPGVFGIQAIFNDEPIEMEEIAERTMSPGTREVEMPFVATDSRLYHWVLTSNGGVALTVLDSSGHVVLTLEATAGKGASIDQLLDQGTYTLVFTRLDNAASSTSSLQFALSGFELSDLMKPTPIDLSLQPVGASAGTGGTTSWKTVTPPQTIGLARVNPTSYSYLSTFGDQGGVADIEVTIGRGPGGPITSLAAQNRGGRRTVEPLPVPEGAIQPAEGPIAAESESPGQVVATATGLAGSETGVLVAAHQAAQQIAPLPPRIDTASVEEGTGILSGREHPHILAGLFFFGGMAVARKLRNRQNRTSQKELPGEEPGKPDRTRTDRRLSKTYRPLSMTQREPEKARTPNFVATR